MPCDLTIAGRRHAGVLADLSPQGLFVQTDAHAPRGTPVRVRLRQLDGADLELEAEVAHRLVARGGAAAGEGLGLRLVGAPPRRFVELAGAAAEQVRVASRFRVQVKDPERETWSFELNAASSLQAADLALASLGDDWDLVEVEPA